MSKCPDQKPVIVHLVQTYDSNGDKVLVDESIVTHKIFYFELGEMRFQLINGATDKEDAKRIAREKYGIVALRVEIV